MNRFFGGCFFKVTNLLFSEDFSLYLPTRDNQRQGLQSKEAIALKSRGGFRASQPKKGEINIYVT